MDFRALHRGAFCQFPFRWIYYYGSNKSTGKETGKTHLCAVVYQMWKYSAKGKGFHYWLPKFNSKDSAFVFVLELFVLFLSLKQEMEQEMDNNF